MCGFFGCINGDIGLAKAMAALGHRGPDSFGDYIHDEVFLRHFRLAIIGSEAAAHQPMVAFDGSVVIAFNGEIYNYRELAGWMGSPELAELGDTRVLVEFISRFGLKRLDLLNGMFAFVAYFTASRELVLLRDRFGVKPLYYVLNKAGIYFSSEPKSLRAIFPETTLDRNAVFHYLDAGQYPGPAETFFEKISQIEPGTFLSFQNGRRQVGRWYDIKQEILAIDSSKLSFEEYESLLDDAVRLRLRSDVPVSLHYSAGTDSTALLLKVRDVLPDGMAMPTFTMAFDDPEVDESGLAETYSRSVGSQNFKVFLSASEVPKLAAELHYFQDEPYGGVPTIAYYKMNQAERDQGYIVSLEGQGGDEALGGYLYHAYLAMYDLYVSGKDTALLSIMLEAHQLDIGRVVQGAEALIGNGFQSHTDMTDLRLTRNAKPAEKFIDWLRTIQLHDILLNKIPRTLRFNDRASMACGREIRFPLLDYRVLAYGAAFKLNQKYAEGLGKAPLREIIRRGMPGVYNASKRSVVTPQTNWLRKELRAWVEERLAVLRRAQYLPESYFDAATDFYADPAPRNSFKVWQLINLSFYFDTP